MKIFFTTLILLTTFFQTLTAQIEFKLERLQDDTKWGVYVKHNGDVQTPSNKVNLGSAQVTLVVSTGSSIKELHNHNGIWVQNSIVPSPVENPGYDYISFGYASSLPADAFVNQSQVLLFTFESDEDCPNYLNLIDNQTDPFNNLPNSVNNNPGNNFDVIDQGYLPQLFIYEWSTNYQDCPDVCEWCEQNVSSTKNKTLTTFEVFPNPSTGSFNIDLGDSFEGAAQIQIINNLGQVVYQEKTSSQQIEVNTSLQNGIYSLYIQNSNNSIATQRIIIQK